MKNGWRRTVAATAVGAAAVLGITGCGVGSDLFGNDIEVIAYFDSVAGLYESNDVSVLGMPVGRVLEVEPEGARVKVTMSVDSDVPVPADATAAIVNTSIVTTRHVELSPTYSEGERLQDGSVIQETKSPVEMGELFDSIDRLVTALEGERPGEGPVADLVNITAGIADDNGERLNAALNEFSAAAEVGSANSGAIVEIIRTVQSLTAALVENYPKMQDFSNSITEVADMLGRQSVGLQASLDDLNITLANTTAFLRDNSGTIGGSMGRIAALAENLSDYSRQVVETIDVAPLLFQNLSNSVSIEQGAWRAQVLLDKSLLDNELLSTFCEAIDLQEDGCRTGQLKDFGPDLGVFSALLGLIEQ